MQKLIFGLLAVVLGCQVGVCQIETNIVPWVESLTPAQKEVAKKVVIGLSECLVVSQTMGQRWKAQFQSVEKQGVYSRPARFVALASKIPTNGLPDDFAAVWRGYLAVMRQDSRDLPHAIEALHGLSTGGAGMLGVLKMAYDQQKEQDARKVAYEALKVCAARYGWQD